MPEPIVRIVPSPPEPHVIDLLEKMLVKAKAGELQSCTVLVKGVAGVYDLYIAGEKEYITIMGQLEHMKQTMSEMAWRSQNAK